MKKKKIILLLFLIVSVASCTPGELENSGTNPEMTATHTKIIEDVVVTPTPTKTEEPQEISISILMIDYIPNETDLWLNEVVIPDFNNKFPYITVEITFSSFREYETKIDDLMLGRSNFDIIQFNTSVPENVKDVLVGVNISDWLVENQFLSATFEELTNHDDDMGVPIYTLAFSLYCRRDLLNENGFEKNPVTFDDLIDVIAEMSVINYLGEFISYGFVSDGGLYSFDEFISLVQTDDGSLFGEDGQINFKSQQAKIVLEFFMERYQAPEPISEMDLIPNGDLMVLESGAVACFWGNHNDLPSAEDQLWDVIDLSAGVSKTGTDPLVMVRSGWFGIPAQSEESEEALEFIKFFSSVENLYEYNQQLGTIPPRLDSWYGIFSEGYFPNLVEIIDDNGIGFITPANFEKIKNIFYHEVDKYIRGVQDLDTTINNIQGSYK